jgi:hypothetical protein
MKENGFKNPPYAFYPISLGVELTLARPNLDEVFMKVGEVVETSSPPINGKSEKYHHEAFFHPRHSKLMCDIEVAWEV